MSVQFENLEIRQGNFCLKADLEIRAQASVAVMGPSGAGKSTLLSALAGFVTPDKGRIIIDGLDVTQLTPAKRPLSMVFQDNNLFPHLSVEQNVGLGLDPRLKLNGAQKTRVAATLERVGLRELATRKPAALSGGQQSRVALARALLRGRPVLLLDEPFAALGPALRYEMLDLVAEIVAQEHMTLLMITHEPRDAARIADEIVLVADGQANMPAPVDETLSNPPKALRDYLGA